MKIASSMFLIAILLSATIVINIDFAQAQTFPENYVKDRLLVKFKDFVSENQKNGILKQNNAIQTDEISQIDVLILNVPENALEKIQSALSKNPNVEYVEKDWILETTQIPNDPNYSNQWHLSKISANIAWDSTTGNSAPIAILDTGIDSSHPDLSGKIQNGWNFYNNNSDLTDSCGHGTKVAGAAAASSNNNIGVTGVAWINPIIPIIAITKSLSARSPIPIP